MEELAEGIRTSLKDGMSDKKVLSNRIIYGENQPEEPKNSKKLKKIILDEFLSPYFLIPLLVFFPIFLYGLKTSTIYYEYSNMPITLMTIAAIVRIIISYVFSHRLRKSSMEKIRNSKYCVQRDGKLIEVEEN